MSVTPYTGRSPGIDWREINRISRQSGRAQGSGDFFNMLTEYQREQRKLQAEMQAAQEALYEEAAGDEPIKSEEDEKESSQIDTAPEGETDNESVNEYLEQNEGADPLGLNMMGAHQDPKEGTEGSGSAKEGDMGLGMLEAGMDVLSRPVQFVSGWATEQQARGNKEFDKKKISDYSGWDKFQSAFFGIIPNSFTDLGRGWEAATKSGGADMRSENAKGWYDWITEVEIDEAKYGKKPRPNWQKNLEAFALDLTADPLNFVGVGLATKPVKATRVAGDALSKSSKVAPMTDEVIQKIADLKLSIAHHTPETEEITHSIVDKQTLEEIFGFPTGPNAKNRSLSGSERTSFIRSSMEKVEQIKAAVNDADFDEMVSPVLKSLNDQIDSARAALPTEAKIKDYGKRVYGQTLRRLKEKGEYPDLPANIKKSKIMEDVEEVVDMPRLGRMVNARDAAVRSANKAKKKGPAQAAHAKYAAQHKATLTKEQGNWFKAHGYTDEDIDDALKAVQTNKEDKPHRLYSEANVGRIRAQIRAAEKDLKGNTNPETGKAWTKEQRETVERKIANQKAEIPKIYNTIRERATERLSEVVSSRRQDAILENHPRLKTISTEIERIQDRINVLEETEGVSSGQDIKTISEGEAGVNSLGDAIPGQGESGALEKLRSQQRALIKEQDEIVKDFKENKERFRTSKAAIKREDVSPEEWDRLKTERIEELEKVEVDKALDTMKREKRKGGGSVALHKATGGNKDGKARVSVGGDELTYPEFVKKAKTDKSLVTEGDVKRANYLTSKKEKKGNIVTDETVAFERIFKEQNDMTLKQFGELKVKAKEEAALKRIKYGDKEYTQGDYIEMRRKELGKVREPTDTIPWNKATVTRKLYVEKDMGSHQEFDALLKEYADESPDAFNKMIRDQWSKNYERARGHRAPNQARFTGTEASLTKAEQLTARKIGHERAVKKVEAETASGELKFTKPQHHQLTFKTPVEKIVEDDKTLLVRQKRADAETKAEAKRIEREQAKLENREPQIAAIDDLYKKREEARRQARTEAVAMKKQLIKDLEVTSLVNIINNTVDEARTILRVNVAGIPIDVPTPESVYKMGDAFGRIAVLQKARTQWGKAFIGSSGLENELQLTRLRAVNDSPRLIEARVEQLKHDFAGSKIPDRKDSFNWVKQGGEPRNALDRATIETLDQMVKYFTNKVRLSSDSFMTLTPADINMFIGTERFKVKASNNKDKYLEIGKGSDILKYVNIDAKDDPLRFMWEVAAAQEQALAYSAMKDTIRNTFGVRYNASVSDQVSMLRKNHGWRSVHNVGDDYLFDPDIANQVNTMMEMLKPVNTNDVMKMYDKAMHAWKGAVTVYNVPGYYARNGIGELIMGLFDGVNNARHYRAAARLIRYDAPDEIKESLKALRPWDTFQTKAQQGGSILARRKHGKDLSTAEVAVLYRDQGLHTGFVSSEFDTNVPLEGLSIRDSAVGKTASKINAGVRKRAEKFEDYWRYAHFVSRLERSTIRDTVKAAEEAARYVRKYHFDYTDFTPFEKSAMTRLFPFYKWTRKSMPLMGSLLFSKPGAMMVYPKTANYLQNPLGDQSQDDNGFLPNWEGTVLPEWMRGMAAYNWSGIMGGDSQTGMNLSTPQFDSFKGLSDPNSLWQQMLTPGLKIPGDLSGAGGTRTDAEGNEVKKTMWDGFPIESKLEYLSRQFPQGSFGISLRDRMSDDKSDNPDVKTRIASFLSGMGLYDMAASGATTVDGSTPAGASSSSSSSNSGSSSSSGSSIDKKKQKLLDLLMEMKANEANKPSGNSYEYTGNIPKEFQ